MNLPENYLIGDKKIRRGFTLVEVMVSITIFSVAAVVAFGVFTRSIDSQGKSTAAKHLQESAHYALAYMMNDLAHAKAGGGEECSAAACSGTNLYFCAPDEATLIFEHKTSGCTTYELADDNGIPRLRVTREGFAQDLVVGSMETVSFKATVHNIPVQTRPSGAATVSIGVRYLIGPYRDTLLLQSTSVMSEELDDLH